MQNRTDYWYYYPFLQNAAVVDAGGCEIYVIVPASEWSVFVYPVNEMTKKPNTEMIWKRLIMKDRRMKSFSSV